MHFYDLHGEEINSEFHSRVIGVGFEVLKHIPRAVGIAWGPDKYKAILEALNGRVIKPLITNKATVERLCQEA